MVTYNAGLVQKIGNREYELLSNKWHNLHCNIITTNIDLDGGKTLNICYSKELKSGTESICMYWYRHGELGHYRSKGYSSSDVDKVPVKYYDLIAELASMYNEINFDTLPNPKSGKVSDECIDLFVKVLNFKIEKGILYCSILTRGNSQVLAKFENSFKVHSEKSNIKLEKHADGVFKLLDIEFIDLRLTLLSFMKSYKTKLSSNVNIGNIPDKQARNLVIETFNRVYNYK